MRTVNTDNGYVVCNGNILKILDIADILLSEGCFTVRVCAAGPCTLKGPVALFDPDGVKVCEGFQVPRRRVRRGDRVGLTLRLRVAYFEDASFVWDS